MVNKSKAFTLFALRMGGRILTRQCIENLELPRILGITRINPVFIGHNEKEFAPRILGTKRQSAIIYSEPNTRIENLICWDQSF